MPQGRAISSVNIQEHKNTKMSRKPDILDSFSSARPAACAPTFLDTAPADTAHLQSKNAHDGRVEALDFVFDTEPEEKHPGAETNKVDGCESSARLQNSDCDTIDRNVCIVSQVTNDKDHVDIDSAAPLEKIYLKKLEGGSEIDIISSDRKDESITGDDSHENSCVDDGLFDPFEDEEVASGHMNGNAGHANQDSKQENGEATAAAAPQPDEGCKMTPHTSRGGSTRNVRRHLVTLKTPAAAPPAKDQERDGSRKRLREKSEEITDKNHGASLESADVAFYSSSNNLVAPPAPPASATANAEPQDNSLLAGGSKASVAAVPPANTAAMPPSSAALPPASPINERVELQIYWDVENLSGRPYTQPVVLLMSILAQFVADGIIVSNANHCTHVYFVDREIGNSRGLNEAEKNQLRDAQCSLVQCTNRKEDADRQITDAIRRQMEYKHSPQSRPIVIVSSDKDFNSIVRAASQEGFPVYVVHEAYPNTMHQNLLGFYARQLFDARELVNKYYPEYFSENNAVSVKSYETESDHVKSNGNTTKAAVSRDGHRKVGHGGERVRGKDAATSKQPIPQLPTSTQPTAKKSTPQSTVKQSVSSQPATTTKQAPAKQLTGKDSNVSQRNPPSQRDQRQQHLPPQNQSSSSQNSSSKKSDSNLQHASSSRATNSGSLSANVAPTYTSAASNTSHISAISVSANGGRKRESDNHSSISTRAGQHENAPSNIGQHNSSSASSSGAVIANNNRSTASNNASSIFAPSSATPEEIKWAQEYIRFYGLDMNAIFKQEGFQRVKVIYEELHRRNQSENAEHLARAVRHLRGQPGPGSHANTYSAPPFHQHTHQQRPQQHQPHNNLERQYQQPQQPLPHQQQPQPTPPYHLSQHQNSQRQLQRPLPHQQHPQQQSYPQLNQPPYHQPQQQQQQRHQQPQPQQQQQMQRFPSQHPPSSMSSSTAVSGNNNSRFAAANSNGPAASSSATPEEIAWAEEFIQFYGLDLAAILTREGYERLERVHNDLNGRGDVTNTEHLKTAVGYLRSVPHLAAQFDLSPVPLTR